LDGYEYNVKRISESKDSSYTQEKEVSEDTIQATPEPGPKGTLIEENIWDDFSDIFEYGAQIAVFTKVKPVHEGGYVRVPAYVKHAIQKLILLSQGKFNDSYQIKNGKVSSNNWREMVFKAMDNLKILKEDGRVWPQDKSKLPKTLDLFLYNTRSGYSWFVKCLETLVTEKEVVINEKYGDTVKDEHTAVFKPWFDYYFYELDYEQTVNLKRNVGELLHEHERLWNEYGQYYTRMGKWNQYLGGQAPDKFLKVFAEFLMTHKFTAHEASIRPTSKAYDAFKRWIHTEYAIDVDMTTKEREELMAKADGKLTAVKPMLTGKMPSLQMNIIAMQGDIN